MSIINDNDNASIYLHIPFCKKACIYCNFHFSTSLAHKNELLDAMLLELQLQSSYLNNKPISTIYIGGGTPSLLTIKELETFFNTIYKHYAVNHLLECTIEVNPDDVNEEYLRSLLSLPVNRLSIGIQSFHDKDLLFMGRSHNATQAEYAIKTAQDTGFHALSIDLIYGIPGSNNNEWEDNLSKMFSYQIPHFSAYALTAEEKTVLYHQIKQKKIEPLDPELTAQQFEILTTRAEQAGYDHYEISNFSLPGQFAVHNTGYWKGHHYLGIGPSAHSYNGHSRQWNIANNARYTNNILQHNNIFFEIEMLTNNQRLNEYIMTSLRTMWGCDLAYIAEKWGNEIAKNIDDKCINYINNGWLVQNNKTMYLTKKGKLFADKIASELFS